MSFTANLYYTVLIIDIDFNYCSIIVVFEFRK